MRKLLAGVAVVAAGLVPVALVAPGAVASTASKAKPPVKIPGSVNNHGTAVATGGVIELDQHDYYYSPTFVQIPAGTTSLTVTVKNMGSTEHNFTVPNDAIDHTFNPGDSMTFTVAVPAKGAFLFYCNIHQSQGMQGAFFGKKGAKLVKAKAASSKSSSSGGSGGRSTSGGYGY
jgi:plastocyanin